MSVEKIKIYKAIENLLDVLAENNSGYVDISFPLSDKNANTVAEFLNEKRYDVVLEKIEDDVTLINISTMTM